MGSQEERETEKKKGVKKGKREKRKEKKLGTCTVRGPLGVEHLASQTRAREASKPQVEGGLDAANTAEKKPSEYPHAPLDPMVDLGRVPVQEILACGWRSYHSYTESIECENQILRGHESQRHLQDRVACRDPDRN